MAESVADLAAGAEEDRTADGFGEDQDGVAMVLFAALLLEARECVCRWRSKMSGNRGDDDLTGFGKAFAPAGESDRAVYFRVAGCALGHFLTKHDGCDCGPIGGSVGIACPGFG